MYDNFKLRKLKMLSGLGVEAAYEEKKMVGDETHWDLVDKKSATNRHPDLGVAFKGLKIHVATIFSMLAVGMYKPVEDFNDDEHTMLNELLNQITITGITLSGELNEETGKDARGVVITATKEVLNSKTLVLNTPRIDFNNPVYEKVDEIIDLCDKITEEAYAYLFKRKYAQASLFEAIEATEGAQSEEAVADGVDANAMGDKIEKEKQAFKAQKLKEKKAAEKKKVHAKKKPSKADLQVAADKATKEVTA